MDQDRWIDVKSKVEGLGLKLKLHLQQEDDDAAEREPGSTRAAFDDLGERLEDAFEAFGNAAKDPAVRADVQEIGLLLKDAIRETVSGVGAEVGDRFRASGDTADAAESGPFKASDADDVQDTVHEDAVHEDALADGVEDAVEDDDL
ncbi:MAG: hypothetical protein AAFO29_11080 [Actinomycetota bacterium]